MSRIARTPSSTGIYHAILRGINKQQIFECHQDYLYFEDILRIVCGLDPLEKRPRKHARRRKGAYVNDEQLSSLYLPQAETEEEEGISRNLSPVILDLIHWRRDRESMPVDGKEHMSTMSSCQVYICRKQKLRKKKESA